MRLRQMAVAFLQNEEQEVLFLQKRAKNTFLAGHLVPIGGHIDGDEINDPKKACIREIEEETGIKSDCIEDLSLRYIVHRVKDNQEIRIQYVFFGNISKNSTLIESDEGTLEWLNCSEIPNRNVSETTIEIARHYLELGAATEKTYVGSMSSLNGNPQINWALLEDWEPSFFNY
ncbi:NUDIX domain-containing protein [Bacillus sp. SD088]|uniref:NUDIX domain-containing protein n=1 Tax=Bacillus sp. SD088 TaxID=2782012 RepID=UPI001A96749D|nr:NUDIX domain-containing protein [Bacillus sp. SD088]MBO0992764.1 NUDIX domain-containing protein [Bacillus sp. SD088]